MQYLKRSSQIGSGISILLLWVGISLLSGCQKPLFPEDAPRTQFEMHDRLHNRYTPREIPDAFGNPQPALRERLSQRH